MQIYGFLLKRLDLLGERICACLQVATITILQADSSIAFCVVIQFRALDRKLFLFCFITRISAITAPRRRTWFWCFKSSNFGTMSCGSLISLSHVLTDALDILDRRRNCREVFLFDFLIDLD